MTCRICLEDGDLICPCKCSGTSAHVHAECLKRWLDVSGRTSCEICKHEFAKEVVVSECNVCPRVSLSEKHVENNLLVVVGFIMFFLLTSLALITDEGFLDVFVLVNTMQMLMLYCVMSEHMNAGETLFFWKVMSSLAFAVGVVTMGMSSIADLEWILTGCIGVIVYIKLVRKTETRTVLYLDYINEAET